MKEMSKRYYQFEKVLKVMEKVIIGTFICIIVIGGSIKITDATVTEQYENKETVMKAQTEGILAQHGLEWNDNQIVEIQK